jgi:cyclic pyranopterin monophosphate synthase
MKKLSHLDRKNRPRMVNVGAKAVTRRVAVAEAIVVAPPVVMRQFSGGEIRSKKGPVFQTAILAGIMAAKKTSELIPMCHPLGLDDCKIEVAVRGKREIIITCRCEIHHKTGVEMEALTGATVAALTIYDMCKALSHDIVIQDVRLMEKTGGKEDFRR